PEDRDHSGAADVLRYGVAERAQLGRHSGSGLYLGTRKLRMPVQIDVQRVRLRVRDIDFRRRGAGGALHRETPHRRRHTAPGESPSNRDHRMLRAQLGLQAISASVTRRFRRKLRPWSCSRAEAWTVSAPAMGARLWFALGHWRTTHKAPPSPNGQGQRRWVAAVSWSAARERESPARTRTR